MTLAPQWPLRVWAVLEPPSVSAAGADQVRALLRPCPDAMLAFHPVAKAVGNVRNDGPELIEAV